MAYSHLKTIKPEPIMSAIKMDQARLNEIFPPSKTDDFFEAIYGGAEDGAYDIVLTSRNISDNKADMAFELRRRKGQCLKCSLTYGLPEVFKRHPILNINGLALDIAHILGWEGTPEWQIRPVEEVSEDLHIIPFIVEKKD